VENIKAKKRFFLKMNYPKFEDENSTLLVKAVENSQETLKNHPLTNQPSPCMAFFKI
jgi:hypothetical protein